MIGQYIQYFKTLAISHPLLLHEDEHNKRSFFAIDFPELLGAFKNGIREKGLALYVLNYQSRFEQLGIEMVEGGFVIMSYFDKTLKGTKQDVYDLTETAAYQIIARLQHDSNLLHPLWHDSLQHLNSFEKVPYKYRVKNDYMGWLVTFQFRHIHNMKAYLGAYSPPDIDESPIFMEGWIYVVEGLAVYKWTQPKTKLTIDASTVLSQYSTVKIQDILNEWSNSLKNLSDTKWSIQGYTLILSFTEVQQGTVWVAGSTQTDRQRYDYRIEEDDIVLTDDNDLTLTDDEGNALIVAGGTAKNWFMIDFSEDITIEGDTLEVVLINSAGNEIPQHEFEFDYTTSQTVKVWLNDPTGDNASGTIDIKVIP